MLANYTITLDEQTVPAILSGILLLVPMFAWRKGVVNVLAHIQYFFRLNSKAATLHKGMLAGLWSICSAASISLYSYLPDYIGAEKFPASIVFGLVIPGLVAVIVSAIFVGSTANGEFPYGLGDNETCRRQKIRKWKADYKARSKYVGD